MIVLTWLLLLLFCCVIYHKQAFLKLQCLYIAVIFLKFYIKIINLFATKDYIELTDTRIIFNEITFYEYLIYLNNKKYKIISIDYLENLNKDVKKRLKNLNLLLHIENELNIDIDHIKPYLFLINENNNIYWDFVLEDLNLQNLKHLNSNFIFYLNDNNLTEKIINIQELRTLKIDEIF